MTEDRILLLHWGQTGAGPKLQLELAKALSNTIGINRFALSFNEQSEMASGLREIGAAVHSVATYERTRKSFLTRAYRIPRLRRSLRSFIRDEGITAVYSVMNNPYQAAATFPLFGNPFRYVATVHDAVPHAGDHALLGSISLRATIQAADHLVTLSQHVTDALRTNNKIPAGGITTLFHPAWDGQIGTPRTGLPTERPVRVGFFGRLLPYKGVQLLLDATRELRKRGHDIEAVIYGSGPEGRLAPEYRDVAPDWNPGWVDDEDIPRLLAGMDILVLPYMEASQSGVLAYALTCGVPVVGTPTGGLVEQISETGAGVIANAISSNAIAESIADLLENESEYIRYSKNGLTAAAGAYSWNRFAERLLPIMTG